MLSPLQYCKKRIDFFKFHLEISLFSPKFGNQLQASYFYSANTSQI
ncbi:hypothetical protein CSUNSWCD_1818 [Campylobacter showae CSUNSWCD]|uniref:Uncharacterized protein n=1 Tax=Campylobacter showae CSUNSWCD TaxID=1244083 RepID=M5IGA0_9BACT|nr:hypothetical protein CSUNSWCD_1818 [Campylobacter showae CSUNSWCD]